MSEIRWQRWGAASGLAAIAMGAAATVFERGPLTASDPAATVVDHLTRYHTPMLAQSMLFLASSALYLWYLGSLRTHLQNAEGGTGRLSAVAFGAGTVWVAVNMVAQAFQIGLATSPSTGAPAALIGTMKRGVHHRRAPAGGDDSRRRRRVAAVPGLPDRLGWVAAATALSQVLLWVGTVAERGPLAPEGWLSYALCPVFLVWLIPATVVMIRRAGHPALPATVPGAERRLAGHVR